MALRWDLGSGAAMEDFLPEEHALSLSLKERRGNVTC